jgi:hypothetical protein
MAPKKKTRSRSKAPSSLEAAFATLWAEVAAGSPKLATLESEVTIKPRRWRFDFLIPGTNILIECQGGTYSWKRMGHSTGEGLFRDYAKSRFAQMRGYICLAYDSKQITKAELEILYVYVVQSFPHLA